MTDTTRPTSPTKRVRRTVLRGIAGAAAAATGLLAAVALSATAATPSTGTLPAGGTLSAGQAVPSPDGHYTLTMQSDGNLVEYVTHGSALWSSKTHGTKATHAVLERNGNLVLLDRHGATVWSSNSHTTGCPELLLQNDGNAVIYAPSAVWADGVIHSSLSPGEVLQSGWRLYSPSPEHYALIMQSDGNLLLQDGAGKDLWQTRTYHHPGAYATMQTDGNLVVYAPGGHVLWSSATNGHSGAHALLQTDGNFVVYGSGGNALWSSKTNGTRTLASLAPKAPTSVSCPAPTTTTTAPTTPTVTVTQPVVTTPVTTPVPRPAPRPRALRIRLAISWTWNHSSTRLKRTKVGTFPGRTYLLVSCRGRGCPRHSKLSGRGHHLIYRLLRDLNGRYYRAGDRLYITLQAPGYRDERAEIDFRNGAMPRVRLL